MVIHWLPLILVLPYSVIMIRLYRQLAGLKSFTPGKKPLLTVSVIIACRNEERKITRLLESLSAQTYPADQFEVLVIDDHSEDNTFGTASSFRFPGKLHVIRNQGKGKKAALATGVNRASFSHILCTDADCLPGKNWISTVAACFEASSPDLIIAPVELSASGGATGWFQELEFLALQAVTAASAAGGKPVLCNGANLAFAGEAYLRHSGNLHHEKESGDDMFLLQSIRKTRGSTIVWLESDEGKVIAEAARGIVHFLRQRKRWISKWNMYYDPQTNLLGIAVFVAVCTQLALCIAAAAVHSFALPLAVLLLIKSVPDYLLLRNTCRRYGKKKLMRWFIPAQLVYPIYVAAVIAAPLRGGWHGKG